MFRRVFIALALAFVLAFIADVRAQRLPFSLWFVGAGVVALGARDLVQRRHALLRNYPVIGHFRYLSELIRPELRQYFGESDTDGVPFDRETRSLVYRRAKGDLDSVPFGTKRNLAASGVEWIPHSMYPQPARKEESRVVIGAGTSSAPYACSRLNVAAMSYGALSGPAIRALSKGARLGGFALNSGEGGVSSHHLEGGGSLIWQLGTAYFGCRTADGRFDPARFAETAAHENVKMIEVKLSQGGKPGYGGVLPASKVSAEIAAIRGVRKGERVVSPPAHPDIESPRDLLRFVERLRDLSGNKPVGIKLCVGSEREVVDLVRAMATTGIAADYIVVDGAEGGTGAAPLEFTNHVGAPLENGLVLMVDTLRRLGLRERVRVFASGRVLTGFDLFRAIALGADGCFSGRGMMLALGCLQALRCNTNDCPVGIATQDPALSSALDVTDKAERVRRYHAATIASFHSLLGAVGAREPSELDRRHVLRRISLTKSASLAELYPELQTTPALGVPRHATELVNSQRSGEPILRGTVAS
jgi:glutamate synthase domain-containing protein 2